MKYNRKYIYYCLLIAINIFCFCPELSAQGRVSRVKKRYAYLIEKAQKAYHNYQFEEANKFLETYKQRLKRRRVSADSTVLALTEQTKKAQRLLSYAQNVHPVDSLQFPRQAIQKVLSERSPFLAKTLKFSLDSTEFNVGYSSPLTSFSFDAKRGASWDLFKADKLSPELASGKSAEKFSESINSAENERNPFMLSSGDILIFSRNSNKGIGGYDLYYARYNVERKTFYKAKILGMPFNSIYNDYLLAYDDEQGLSYLVSDRYCPKDSLVLYRFAGLPNAVSDSSIIPNNEDATSTKANGQFAKKLDSTFVMPKLHKAKKNSLYLPLRDGIILTSCGDFRSTEALSYYQDYKACQEEIKNKKAYQKDLRQRYKEGDKSYAEELQKLEQELLELQRKQKEVLIKCKNAEIEHRK